MRPSIGDLIARIKKLKREIYDLKEKLKRADQKDTQQVSRDMFIRIAEKYRKLDEDYRNLEKTLIDSNYENGNLKDEFDKLKEDYSKLFKEYSEIVAKLQNAEKQIEELKEDLAIEISNHEATLSYLKKALNDVYELRKKLGNTEAENAKLENEIKSLKATIEDLEKYIGFLEEGFSKVSKDLIKAQQDSEERTKLIAEYKEKYENAQDFISENYNFDIVVFKQKLEETEQKLKEAEEERGQAIADARAAEKEVPKAKKQGFVKGSLVTGILALALVCGIGACVKYCGPSKTKTVTPPTSSSEVDDSSLSNPNSSSTGNSSSSNVESSTGDSNSSTGNSSSSNPNSSSTGNSSSSNPGTSNPGDSSEVVSGVIEIEVNNITDKMHAQLTDKTFGGYITEIKSCQYNSVDGTVSVLVECDSDYGLYLKHVTFDANETVNESNLITTMGNADNISHSVFIKDLGSGFEGKVVKTTINGVEVEGLCSIKYSATRDYQEDIGETSFVVKGIVLVNSEEGLQYQEISTTYNHLGDVTILEVETDLKNTLEKEIEDTLNIVVVENGNMVSSSRLIYVGDEVVGYLPENSIDSDYANE